MPRIALAVLAAYLFGASPCDADAPLGYDFLPFDQGLRLASVERKPVFLYFGRYGCTFCDMTNKRAFADQEVRERYIDRYVLVYVDAESGRRLELPSGERITEAELGARLQVYITPFFAFLDPDGEPLGVTAGVKTAAELLAMDRYISEGHYREMSLHEFIMSLEP
jgi:thioredoxin-related protein